MPQNEDDYETDGKKKCVQRTRESREECGQRHAVTSFFFSK
jgi:hypothetical protein